MTHDPGVAGASARREHERRRANDEARTREKWGVFGDVAVALSGERQSTRAWSTGALGEEAVGARLDQIASPTIYVLHDRRIPGSRANIDHIVVTSGAIWVVDAKKYSGRPELRVEGGILRPRVEKLFIGGRDKSTLLVSAHKQVAHLLSVTGNVPLKAALCFVEADWPLIGGSFVADGVEVLWAKKLVERIRATDTGTFDVAAVTAAIAERFRPA
jgi:hypothetical protein